MEEVFVTGFYGIEEIGSYINMTQDFQVKDYLFSNEALRCYTFNGAKR